MFVAVWPPVEVLHLLAGLDRPAHPDVRWTTPDQWHVTLRFLGRVDDAERSALMTAWEAIELSAAQAVLGPEAKRFGDSILQIPVDGLDLLAASVVAATAAVGEPPDPRPFHGHLTLARARGRTRVLRQLARMPVEASWRVEDIALVVSHTNPAGARYETIARRTLPCDTVGR